MKWQDPSPCSLDWMAEITNVVFVESKSFGLDCQHGTISSFSVFLPISLPFLSFALVLSTPDLIIILVFPVVY
jgi:hypothetical protein